MRGAGIMAGRFALRDGDHLALFSSAAQMALVQRESFDKKMLKLPKGKLTGKDR